MNSNPKPQLKKQTGIRALSKKLLPVAVTTGGIGDPAAVVCKWALRV
jgi:hypothetical protein